MQVRSRHSDNGGGRFSHNLDLFQDLKIGVPSGCLGETSVFKITVIDNAICG